MAMSKLQDEIIEEIENGSVDEGMVEDFLNSEDYGTEGSPT